VRLGYIFLDAASVLFYVYRVDIRTARQIDVTRAVVDLMNDDAELRNAIARTENSHGHKELRKPCRGYSG